VFAATTFETFVIGLFGASVPVGLGAWFVRRKTKAETTDLITQAAGNVVEMMQAQIVELRRELSTLRDRVAAEQSERAAMHLRLVHSEERERVAVRRIGELQAEVDALRLRVARYETPVVTTTTTVTTTEENPS
jgi:chromosome segregation ATPase